MSKLDDLIPLLCPKCKNPYENNNQMMIICPKSHYCCYQCTKELKGQAYIKHFFCPFCKTLMKSQQVKPFQHFHIYLKLIENKKANEATIKVLIDTAKQIESNKTIQMTPKELKYKIQSQQRKCKKLMIILMEEAEECFINYNYQKTIRICRQIIQSNPQQSQNFYGFGGKQEYIRDKQSYIRKIYLQHMNDTQFRSPYDLLSLSLLLKGDYQNDRNWYQFLIKDHKSNYQLQFGLGLLLENYNHTQQAIQSFVRVNNLKSNFQKVHQHLAFQYYRSGKLSQARFCALTCLNINPNNLYSLYLKAMTSSQDVLVKQLKQLAALTNYQYLLPLNELGKIYYYELREYQNALFWLNKCFQKSQCYDSTPVIKAGCLFQLQKYEEAIELLNIFIAQNENVENKNIQEAYIVLSRAYCKCFKPIEAHTALDQSKCTDSKKQLYLAEICMAQLNYGLALEWYHTYLKNNPQEIITYFYIGILYENMNNQEDALLNFNKYEKQASQLKQNIQITFKLAQKYYAHNKIDLAIKLYLKCAKKKYFANKVYPQIIKIQDERKNFHKVKQYLEKWKKIDSEIHQSSKEIASIESRLKELINNKEWNPKKRKN